MFLTITMYLYAVFGAFSKVITGSLSYFWGRIWCEHAPTVYYMLLVSYNIALRIIYFNQSINQSVNGLYFKRIVHDSKETDDPIALYPWLKLFQTIFLSWTHLIVLLLKFKNDCSRFNNFFSKKFLRIIFYDTDTDEIQGYFQWQKFHTNGRYNMFIFHMLRYQSCHDYSSLKE